MNAISPLDAPAPLRVLSRLKTILPRLLPLLIVIVLFFFIERQIQGFKFDKVIAGMGDFSWPVLLLCSALIFLSYSIGGFYDNIAARYFRLEVTSRQAFLTGLLATTFAVNVGFSTLSGAAVRYRLYSQWGITVGTIAKISVFHALTFWLGILLVLGLVGVLYGEQFSHYLQYDLSGDLVSIIAFMLLVLYGIVAWWSIKGKSIAFRGFELKIPPFKIFIWQSVTSCADWLVTVYIFYLLLPATPSIDFSLLLIIFLVAQLIGFASSIPAGLGAFDGTVLLLLGPFYGSTEQVLSTLLLYRLLAYLLPFIISAVAFGGYELYQHRQHIVTATSLAKRLNQALIPRFTAAVIFLAGLLLIVSGGVPSSDEHLQWVSLIFPHTMVEASHFLASLVGIGLLIVARGLLYRSKTSFYITTALLALGIIFSLSKGWHIATAAVLLLVLMALIPTHTFFYRKQASLRNLLSLYWLCCLLIITACIFYFLHWEQQGENYSHYMWWKFELLNDVPRTIRAMLGVAITLSVLVLFRLIYSPATPVDERSRIDLKAVDRVVRSADSCEGYLAFLGDKHILFDEQQSAFIMYGIQGRTWVSMGDPIGDAESTPELVWRFCELADEHGAWPVFYEVGSDNLSTYLDLGFSIHKIGEFARVKLSGFTLKGKAHSGLRQSVNKVIREGGSFEIIPAEGVADILSELRLISDQWLADKNSREKGFSLGFFDEVYLSYHQPVAVVRVDGKIVAFSNIWVTDKSYEFTIDLMRFTKDAPNGVMDYLFAQLQLWGQEQGYQWFSLGMVPFSGVKYGLRTTRWNDLINLIYKHGEHFYNFEGLRHYKNKFSPEWESRYLVSPGGLRSALALRDISTLISGSTMGTLKK